MTSVESTARRLRPALGSDGDAAVTTVDTWLGDGAILATLHLPDSASTVGVVICPPIGYEYAIAYRTLRHLADRVSAAGMAVVRYDHPGFGDSGVELEPGSLQDGARLAGDALRASGVTSVVYLGLGSGALVASLAAEADPEPAGLVLWDPAASGRQWFRRQRSIYRIEVGPLAEPGPEGTLEIAGAQFPAWFADLVCGLDYDPRVPTTVPTLIARRAGEPSTIPKSLRALSPHVDTVEVPGHDRALDVSSIAASIPRESVEAVVGWLRRRFSADEGSHRIVPVIPEAATRMSASYEGAMIEERLRRLGPNDLFAVETRPASGGDDAPVVVLHNGSAEHRIGTTRYQVLLARRLAASGIRAVRVDRRGTGESSPVRFDEPNLLFTQEWLDDGADVLAALETPREKVGVIGMCVGSWVGLVAAPARVAFVAALAVNDHRARPQAPQPVSIGLDPVVATRALRVRLMSLAKRKLPYRLLLVLARRGAAHLAEPNLRLALAAGADVHVLLSPSDAEIFRTHHGDRAVRRLRRLPGTLTVAEHPTGDHALYSPGIRARAVDEAYELAVRTFAGKD